MTDLTNTTPEDLSPSDEPMATATVAHELSEAEKEAIQVELDKTTTPTPTAAKPRVRAGKPVDKPVDKKDTVDTSKVSQPDPLLVDILCWPRRHDSAAEQAFAEWLKNLPFVQKLERKNLSLGSWAWEVPGPAKDKVAFSCHIDTVDDYDSCKDPKARKRLTFDPGMDIIGLDKSHKVGSCLGADDGTGVWMLLKMIQAKVPGTYVFHRGEECGGLTAKGNAKDFKEYFSKFKTIIAFDRANDADVIITQGGSVCASEGFGKELALALNAADADKRFAYKTSTNGVYTDTKDYRGVIGECINLSVGYASQHGPNEYQDWDHAKRMLHACIMIDWAGLAAKATREPYMAEPPTTGRGWSSRDLYGGTDDFFGGSTVKAKGRMPTTKPPRGTEQAKATLELDYFTYGDLMALVDDDPEEAKRVISLYMRERARLLADISTLEAIVDELR